jgi:alpha-tubulin suppressor-like RCC1 family protein
MLLTESGEVFGWGKTPNGELATPGVKKIPVPTLIKEITRLGVRTLICGGSQGLALLWNGSLMGWGYNQSGTLGTGDLQNRPAPVVIIAAKDSQPFGGISEICCGNSHSIVLMRDGSLMIWGSNDYSQTGMQSALLVPTIIKLPSNMEEGRMTKEEGDRSSGKAMFIGTGMNNTFVLREDGVLFVWGLSSGGQLGVEGMVGNIPTAMPNLKFCIPPLWTEEAWRQIFSWLFLGIQDRSSDFSQIPVEVIFALVSFVYV